MNVVLARPTKGSASAVASFRVALTRPSEGASDDARLIEGSLKEIKLRQTSPGSRREMLKGPWVAPPLPERLYDALANAKVMTSQIAMHLAAEWRDRLFAQLDDLLNDEDWHQDDEPLLDASFATFLRLILYQRPERRPGLGLSHRGHLIAAWTEGADRLTLECLPGDTIRWVLSCDVHGQRERAAGETHVVRLPEVLGPYHPARWFAHAAEAACR